MKKYLLIAIAVLLTTFVSAQNVVFHENFEAPSYGDSLISSADSGGLATTFRPWSISTNLYREGLRSDTNTRQNGKTIYLKSIPFSTVNNYYVILQFSQICKLHVYDGGFIDVSNNNGSTWTTLTTTQYQGSGSMVQNKFCENSYTAWLPGDTTTPVTNAWWEDEKFDISALVGNSANVLIRFRYTTSGQPIASGRYGWLIDAVKVSASPCQLAAPTITMISYTTGTISASTAPAYYTISAYIKDALNTNIDTAYIKYQINNGAFNTIYMTKTNDTTFSGNLPFPGWGKTVNYNITGVDSSCNNTYAYSPSTGYYTFNTVYTGNSLPYDAGITQITAPSGGVAINTPIIVTATLKNYGTTTLTKATIVTSLNGVVQSPAHIWTGSLAQNATATFNVDTIPGISTAGAYNLKVWSQSPNDSLDLYDINDTAYGQFYVCTSVFNGTYTIGGTPGANNFATFNLALSGLEQCGLSGPVVFNVAAGTYTEQLDIPPIPGSSSTNTITFQGATSDSTLVILSYNASTAATNFVVRLKGSQYITFKSMTIQPTNATYANAVVFMSGTSNISLISNLLIGTQTVNTDTNQYVIRTTTGTNYNTITFKNNRINYGSYGLSFVSANSALTTNITVHNNYFYNSSGRPAQFQHINGLDFDNNTVNISTAQTACAGLYMDSVNGQWNFYNNNMTNLGGTRVFELQASRGTGVGSEALIYNNYMYAGSAAASYVCYFEGGLNNIKFLFNTVVGSPTSSVMNVANTYGTNSNITIENNLFSGTLKLISITAAPTTFTTDYNDYYTTGATLGTYTTTNCATIAAWKTATGQESHSISLNPMFAATGSPQATNTALVTSGIAIPGITTDLYGRQRATIPCVGAYEVFLIPYDAGVISILSPSSTETESNSIPVNVVVRNFGTNPITNMSIIYKLNGGTPISYNFVGNIPSLAVDTVTLQNMIVPLGPNNICAYTVLTGDTDTANDQTCKSFVGNPLYDAQLKTTYALTGGCGLTTEPVKIAIKNLGAATINGNCTVSYKVVGSTTVVTENMDSVINSGDTLVYTFVTPVNLSVTNTDVTDTIKTWVTLLNDHVPGNDSSSTSVQSLHTPPLPIANNVTIPYATSVTATASSPTNDPIYWYQQLTGGTSILTGTQYTTPVLYASDTLYLQSSTNFTLDTVIGTGTVQNSTTSYPTPYGIFFTGAREQYLILASELTALGLQSGPIQSCGFYVVTPSTASSNGTAPTNTHMKNFTVKIGTTTQNALTTTYVTGLTQVYFNSMYNDVTGWNMHQFSTPFIWDGTSNVVIEICHDKYVSGSDYGYNAIVDQTNTSFVSTTANYADAASQCSATGTYTYSQRPNIRLTSNIQGCTSTPRVPLIVTVGSQPPNDIGVTSIISPVSNINLTNHETVTVYITNHGTSPATNFNVSFKVDNVLIATESYTGTINSDSTNSYTFTATANLSTVGHTYKITAYTTMVGDATTINDTTIVYVTNNPLVYCTSASEYSIYDDISNVTFGGIDNTSGGSTYSDFTSLTPALVTQTIPTPLSITIGGTPYISGETYYLRAWIDLNHDGVFDPVTEQVYTNNFTRTSGDQTFTTYITVPITATLGITRMRIIVDYYYAPTPCWLYPSSSYYEGGETEDYSVNIVPPLPNDAGITKVKFPQTYIPYNANPTYLTPQLVIKDFGLDSLGQATVYYNYNGTVNNFPWSITPKLATSATDTFNIYSVTVNEGLNTMVAYTSLPGDSNYFNDTAKATVFKEHLASIPYSDDFETNRYWFATDTNAGAAITNLWQQGIPASSIINSAHSPVNVWKTVLNGNAPMANNSVLYSPLFNFAMNMGDTLKFWQWRQFGNNTYGLIQYLNVFGSWVKLGAANDPNATNWYNNLQGWTGTGTGWELSTYKVSNLSDIANYVQFRFIFNSMTATDSIHNGWAIDDVSLTLLQLAEDAGVTAIITPGSTSTVGDSIAPVVTVKNFGLNPITTMPIKYSINGLTPVTDNWSGTLLTGNTMNYTFNEKYFVNPGNYVICAATALNGDSHYQNDSSCESVTVNPAANDVGITTITSPLNTVGTGSTVTVTVTIKNFGTNPQDTIPVYYQRLPQPPVSAIWIGTALNLGDTVSYTFATTFTAPIGNSFNLCAWTSLTGDTYSPNDKICKSVILGINDDLNMNDLWLGQNIPNPSNGLTVIEYNLPQDGEADFKVIDLLGQLIYSKQITGTAGKHKLELNIKDLSNGVYYYSIEYKGKRLVKKMIISK